MIRKVLFRVKNALNYVSQTLSPGAVPCGSTLVFCRETSKHFKVLDCVRCLSIAETFACLNFKTRHLWMFVGKIRQ